MITENQKEIVKEYLKAVRFNKDRTEHQILNDLIDMFEGFFTNLKEDLSEGDDEN